MKITGLLFWSQDNKISEKFYKKIGFNIKQSDENASVADLNGFLITLVAMREEEPFTNDSMAAERGKGVYTYILVDDVDSFYEKIVHAGLKPSTQPKNWPWGNREFIIKDPDGYKLCFWQRIN